ncbi:MAG: AsmA family protein [Akkermansiaceae bacterium]|nr:AsmA family protein [Akkermansiaceae bacterium]
MRRKRREKMTWKKRLIVGAMILGGSFFLLAVAAGVIAQRLMDKDYLIEEIEKSITSQVEIGEVDISLFRLPAKVTLRDVSLAPLRAGVSGAKPPVQLEQVDLSVGLWGLFNRHVDVTNITIRGAEITATYREDGSTTLGTLFESPDETVRGKSGAKGRGGFNVYDQEEFVTTLGGLIIENSKVDLTLENTGLRLRCSDVYIELSSIRIDPAKLEETNTAKLKIGGKVRMDSTEGRHYGDLYLSGQSTARLFNPQTGSTEPEVEGDFSLSEESWLNTRIPVVTKAWGHLSILEKVGVNIATLPDEASFGRSEAIAAHYHLGRLTVRKPLSIWVGDWEFAAMEDSWLQMETDQHEVNAELLASKDASVRFRSVIMKGLEMIPKEVRSMVVGDLEKQLFRDERLLVNIRSSGDFSDPKIRPVGAVVDLAEAAKEAAKKLLKEKASGFLNGLLGGDDGR